jgi:glycyl-tRNA synthetase
MQEAILRLTRYWTDRGCLLAQPFNTEVGAGTLNPATFLRVLGPEPWSTVYVEPSVRPDDSRYGDNPNRLQTHMQLQVVLKPDPGNSQDLYLESLASIGIDTRIHDVRFVEDNWESPALGAWGLGWEVWLDGLEITQYTYFQQAGGVAVDPVAVEITYGLERILMALQGVTHFKDIHYSDKVTYGEIVGQAEREMSIYYLDQADIEVIWALFETYDAEARRLIALRLPVPAHYYVLKCSHAFNTLDARGAIGTTERARSFSRMRGLAHEVAQLWIERRVELGHPLGLSSPRHAPQVVPDAEVPPSEPATFLLELGFEELPYDQVDSYAEQLNTLLTASLSSSRLTFGRVRTFGSPRRIIAHVEYLSPTQSDQAIRVRGPRRSSAFGPDGTPTPAATGFARKQGVAIDDLSTELDGDVEYLVVIKEEQGRSTSEILTEQLPQVLASMSAPRSMRWSAGPDYTASRALRWIVSLHGRSVVPFSYADVTGGRVTRGLRNSDRQEITILEAESHLETLRSNSIEYDAPTRKARILDGAQRLAASVDGEISTVLDGSLLDEIANLVENPVPILGSFEDEYLRLPHEVLTVVMRKHQRYLPVRTASGGLLARFVSVANGPIDNDTVRGGNEAVLRARFSDAAFFFDRDREHPLEAYRNGLAQLTFEEHAGSMLDRADRVEQLATVLGAELLVDETELETIRRAAYLAKADLATSMVVELSSLAGQMGRVYARLDGEPEAVAQAIFESTLPRFSGDELPATRVGAVLSIADRADQLVAMFAAGAKPSGSNDPYGLRRSAMGLVQVIMDHSLPTGLRSLFSEAASHVRLPFGEDLMEDLLDFVAVRLEVRLVDEGHKVEVVRALEPLFDRPSDVKGALEELEAVQAWPDFTSLSASFRRVRRLSGDTTMMQVNETLLEHPAERSLWAAFAQVETEMSSTTSLRRFFEHLRSLEKAISTFFEEVLVMAENKKVRSNRLAILARINATGEGKLAWDALPES